MSENNLKRLRVITSEDLRRYHAANGVANTRCERCGTDSWSIVSGDTSPAGGIPSAKDEVKVDATLFVPVLMMICNKCGNMWLQSHSQIAKWLDSQPTLRRI